MQDGDGHVRRCWGATARGSSISIYDGGTGVHVGGWRRLATEGQVVRRPLEERHRLGGIPVDSHDDLARHGAPGWGENTSSRQEMREVKAAEKGQTEQVKRNDGRDQARQGTPDGSPTIPSLRTYVRLGDAGCPAPPRIRWRPPPARAKPYDLRA